jgi:YD repeat-containing protein
MGDDWRKSVRSQSGKLIHPNAPEGGGGRGTFRPGIQSGVTDSRVPDPRSPAARSFDWTSLDNFDVDDRAQAVLDALRIAQLHAPEAIKEATGEELHALLEGLIPGLLLAAGVIAASTALGGVAGAAVGALAFGAGAGPGAVAGASLGFDAGLVLLEYLGVAFLAGYIGKSVVDASEVATRAVELAWNSVDQGIGKQDEIDYAGRRLAAALGILMRGILQGVIAFLLAKGTSAVAARASELATKLRTSKFGEGFASWVEARAQGLLDNPRLKDPRAPGPVRTGGGGAKDGASSGGGTGATKASEPPPAKAPATNAADAPAASSTTEASAADRNRVARDKTVNEGHPVDVATGKVFTDKVDAQLPGPLGLFWQRVWYSTSSYRGPLGHGWHHGYDMALQLHSEAVHCRMADGREVTFPLLAQGQSHFDRAEKQTLLRDARGYAIRTSDFLTYRFDAAGKPGELSLTRIEDPSGRSMTLRYDELGRLSELVDAAGRTITCSHDAWGRITALLAPHPEQVGQRFPLARYGYDADGNLSQVTDALDQVEKYRYKHHLLVQETDRKGLSFHFEYDAKDERARCLRTHGDGDLYARTFSYDEARGITTVRDSLGNKTLYEHRGGLVVRKVDPIGAVTLFEYDAFNQQTSQTDALGRHTRYEYDARGQLVAWVARDGVQRRAHYDAQGHLRGLWEGQSRRIAFAHDAQGRVIERIDALGARTQFVYEGRELCAVIDPSGQRTSLAYDALGNLTQLSTPSGAVVRWQYDALGRQVAETDARGNTSRRQHDLLGRLTTLHEPDGNVRELGYDGEGNLTRFKDRHRDVTMTYKGMGRLATRSEAGTTVVFDYDSEERMRVVLNEHSEVYRFERGPSGEVETEHGFGGIRRSFTRDLLGRVTELRRASGHTSRFSYDAMDRLTLVEHSDGDQERYQYREDGALLEASNSARLLRFERDALGRVLEEHQDAHVVTSRYDARGLRTHMCSSLGAEQHITRGVLGEVTALESGPWRAQFSRDLLGDELERELPGGVRSRHHLDQLGRVANHEVVSADKILRARSYRWDVDQRLLELIDVDHGAVRYSYDARGRLALARYTDGTHELRMPDAVGNLFKTEDRRDRTYGPAGELLEVRTRGGHITRYKYDPEGNLTEKLEPSGRTWHYRWNAAGRLAAVIRPDVLTFSEAGRPAPFRWAAPDEVAAESWKFTATPQQQNGWFIRVKP